MNSDKKGRTKSDKDDFPQDFIFRKKNAPVSWSFTRTNVPRKISKVASSKEEVGDLLFDDDHFPFALKEKPVRQPKKVTTIKS